MIQIRFKNLKKSELTHDAVKERIEALVEKFPDLNESKIQVTLEMENSPVQPGPDMFSVKIHIRNGRYGGVTVTKSDLNLYRALAEIVDHMLEKLNRTGDKERVKERAKARRFVQILTEENLNEPSREP